MHSLRQRHFAHPSLNFFLVGTSSLAMISSLSLFLSSFLALWLEAAFAMLGLFMTPCPKPCFGFFGGCVAHLEARLPKDLDLGLEGPLAAFFITGPCDWFEPSFNFTLASFIFSTLSAREMPRLCGAMSFTFSSCTCEVGKPSGAQEGFEGKASEVGTLSKGCEDGRSQSAGQGRGGC